MEVILRKVMFRTYTKSGSYFLPNPPEEMGESICSGYINENRESFISQLITLNSKADVIRYLILVTRDWNDLIEENISNSTLVNNMEALANLYEQIIQLTYLLLSAKFINPGDYQYFAKAINLPLEGSDYPWFKELNPIFKIANFGYVFDFNRIKHQNDPNLLTIITLF